MIHEYDVLFSGELLGVQTAPFSYSKLRRGELILTGLPEGIDLAKSGNVGPIGKAKCRLLLAAESAITLAGKLKYIMLTFEFSVFM